ncbi:hypothetical protein CVT26_001484 [Gymnopilus dilepis]|uniref:Uncharacterized protein n=1 Tax=Gymnopilus dilepis TaxID=231916 RepID=A0A409YUQ0_9AGAR|nr:hypothetical protein CVT26_001484 [Gymnopilus dilepis]
MWNQKGRKDPTTFCMWNQKGRWKKSQSLPSPSPSLDLLRKRLRSSSRTYHLIQMFVQSNILLISYLLQYYYLHSTCTRVLERRTLLSSPTAKLHARCTRVIALSRKSHAHARGCTLFSWGP